MAAGDQGLFLGKDKSIDQESHYHTPPWIIPSEASQTLEMPRTSSENNSTKNLEAWDRAYFMLKFVFSHLGAQNKEPC